MKSLPYFKFNALDWITAENVMQMTAAQCGAYINLLAHCWTQETCTLPNKLSLLTQLAKWDGTPEDFEPVLACFIPSRMPKGRLLNRRLYREWQEATAWRITHQENGKKGAAIRWGDPESKAPRVPKVNGKTAFPEDWKLAPELAESWRPFQIDPYVEFATFRDHARATDRRCKDWPAAFRNWCRKTIRLKEERPHGLPKVYQ